MRLTTLIRTAVVLAAALVLGGTLPTASPATSATSSAPTLAAEEPAVRSAAADADRRTCRAPQCWIAGARNARTGVAFMNWNLSTKAAAVRAAMKQCRNKTRRDSFDSACTKSGNQRHGCLAIAYLVRDGKYQGARSAGADYRSKLTVRETRKKAIRRAKARFGDAKGLRKVWSAHCTAR
jgi:hypothetical protein